MTERAEAAPPGETFNKQRFQHNRARVSVKGARARASLNKTLTAQALDKPGFLGR